MSTNINYIWKDYMDLSIDELYAIINLRQEVFVYEQNCPYIDADYSDQDAFHLLGYKENDLVAYLRAFKPKIKYEGSSIGRIVVKKDYRNLNLGKDITNLERASYLKNFQIMKLLFLHNTGWKNFMKTSDLPQEVMSISKMTLIIYKCLFYLTNDTFIKQQITYFLCYKRSKRVHKMQDFIEKRP